MSFVVRLITIIIFQILHVRQCITQLFGQLARCAIGGHAHWLGGVAERQLHDLVALGFAEDDADRWILVGEFDILVKSREVEVQLTSVFGLELAALQFKGHKAPQFAGEEKQVYVIVMAFNFKMVLVAHESEILAECHDEVLDILNDTLLNHPLVNILWVLNVDEVEQVFILERL